jgi:hypothetical protein
MSVVLAYMKSAAREWVASPLLRERGRVRVIQSEWYV